MKDNLHVAGIHTALDTGHITLCGIFSAQISLNSKFLRTQNIFGAESFSTQKFFEPDIFGTKFFFDMSLFYPIFSKPNFFS